MTEIVVLFERDGNTVKSVYIDGHEIKGVTSLDMHTPVKWDGDVPKPGGPYTISLHFKGAVLIPERVEDEE